MGAWGVGIFSNDTASGVREDFRDLVAEGLSAHEATLRLVHEYGVRVDDSSEDANDFWLGLAATQHRLGYIAPDVIERAQTIARDPSELGRWESSERPRRQNALEALADRLEQPPPPPKRLRPRPKASIAFVPGQHLVVQIGSRVALLRVTRIHEDRGGRVPHVVLVSWNGKERQLRKAHRLPEVSDPVPQRRGGEALGAILVGDPPPENEIRVLDQLVDARTPAQRWSSAHVVNWSGLAQWLDNA